VYGIPAGGVRLAPDISLDEMIRLSRAMSMKFCAYRMKIGGAKAGIWGDPLDKEKKEMLLTSFAKATERFIKNDVYYPGPDMGTNDDDLLKMFSVMGVPNLAPKKIGMVKLGVPVEELFTGYGVVYCLEVIYNNLEKLTKKKYDTSKKPRVILEGDLVNQYTSKNLIRIPKEKLFELSSEYPTDFIIPGARPDVINKKNIDKINAIALVPAANIPYEKGSTDVLKEKGIIAFPDFIANAGEVLAILVNKVAKNAEEIFDYIKSKISGKTFEVIQGAAEKNLSSYDYAVADSLNELTKKIRRKTNSLEKLNRRY
jgi:glutamate dehydrogenase/leucine dehydrogenase